MISIQTYLSSVKQRISDTRLVVLGNEAADLDSMVSSVAYGYLRARQKPGLTVLPVMTIPRADFFLRQEVVYLFHEAGINLDDIVFSDEVDCDKLLLHADLVLVDHNKLGADLLQYGHKVTGVLDHHKDEGLYKTAVPRIIRTIGSTATLVAMEFNKLGVTIGQDLAILLGGTILLDTVNLSMAAGKVTDADKKVAAEILPLCPMPGQELFKKVQSGKFNVQGLSTNDLLRKDYKEYHFGRLQYGIASVHLSTGQWQVMDNDLVAAFSGFAANRKLDLLVSMNSYNRPEFHRELIVFWQTEGGQRKLLKYLQDNELALTPIVCVDEKNRNDGIITFYDQGNRGISRKKLQPLLANFFEVYGGNHSETA
ncbi:MAG: DHHA2 domain-containing protein [Thermodesulfobacteriota bacterium]|nr:DHHA2 domain-containing protein [Thermodesulfobacteriota bacterium]